MQKVFRLKEHWTQKADCRDKDGRAVNINYLSEDNIKHIKCFSLQGAVSYYFSYEKDSVRRYKVMGALKKAIQKYTGKDTPVAQFNDDPNTKFEDIKHVIKIANV